MTLKIVHISIGRRVSKSIWDSLSISLSKSIGFSAVKPVRKSFWGLERDSVSNSINSTANRSLRIKLRHYDPKIRT